MAEDTTDSVTSDARISDAHTSDARIATATGRESDRHGTAHAPSPDVVPRGQTGTARAAPAVPHAEAKPHAWGRIDEAGAVFVRTEHGERQVGVWQAGSAEEGLLHFARRFDDLRVEAELLEARLTSGNGDPRQALTSATQLRDNLDEAAVLGDLAALRFRLEHIISRAEQAAQRAKEDREAIRSAATERKRALVEEAEDLAESATQWKAAGDRLRVMFDEWKAIKGVDRRADDALWKRFIRARDAFSRRRGAHFAELDKQRTTAKARKEELAAEAESLRESQDWANTAARYKELMTEWKAAGKAHREIDDALWQRFRAAQDTFFARRSAAFAERDAELTENARRKEEVLAEAEALEPDRDLDSARSALRGLQQRWEAIGKVPRERARELDRRFAAAAERIRSATETRSPRGDPEAAARAAQFRDRVAQLDEQASKARAAGDEQRARQTERQAEQWREWLQAAEQAVADR